MVRTQIQLRDDQSNTLREMAAESGVSMAELVRQGVDLLIVNRAEPTKEEKWKHALSVIGIASSGLTDLAENHDKYLAEIYAEVGE